MKAENLAVSAATVERAMNGFQPRVALLCGTGLSNALQSRLEAKGELQYGQVPNFPLPTTRHHQGKMIWGNFGNTPALLFAGRLHYYEGYSLDEVTFPVRMTQALGIKALGLTNISGSLNPLHEVGDFVIIEDHINLFPENPLRGYNDERLGVRFPDMLEVYPKAWVNKTLELAQQQGIRAHAGVYVGWQGPSLETPAEYRYLHRIGADVVGMSTVPEAIVARHAGIGVLGLSLVTNLCYPLDRLKPATEEEMVILASQYAPQAAQLLAQAVEAVTG